MKDAKYGMLRHGNLINPTYGTHYNRKVMEYDVAAPSSTVAEIE